MLSVLLMLTPILEKASRVARQSSPSRKPLMVEVPSAKALLVNSTSIDLLTKGNYSHYDFLGVVENFFSKASPALFMGWSNLNFDRRMFHFNFFKGNRYPYITHSSPNKEHDGLHIARAAQTINTKTLKTELTDAGNESLSLIHI